MNLFVFGSCFRMLAVSVSVSGLFFVLVFLTLTRFCKLTLTSSNLAHVCVCVTVCNVGLSVKLPVIWSACSCYCFPLEVSQCRCSLLMIWILYSVLRLVFFLVSSLQLINISLFNIVPLLCVFRQVYVPYYCYWAGRTAQGWWCQHPRCGRHSSSTCW